MDRHIENIMLIELIRVADGAYIQPMPTNHETGTFFSWMIIYKSGAKKYGFTEAGEFATYEEATQNAINFYNANK